MSYGKKLRLLGYAGAIMAILVYAALGCETLVYWMLYHGIDKDYHIKEKNWFEQRIQKWHPNNLNSYRPLLFGVSTNIMIGQIGDLTGEAKSTHSYAFNDKMLDVFRELDVDMIRVGALDDAWRANIPDEINLADKMMAKVRSLKKPVFLADTQHSAHLIKHPVSWEEFSQIHLNRIEFFLKRYKPEYYGVVTEASTYHWFGVKGGMDLNKWTAQIQAAVDLVKNLAPQVKTVVVIGPKDKNEQLLFKKLLSIKNLDIIGLELYYPEEFDIIEKLLQDHPHNYGKQVWIGESWSGMPVPYTRVTKKPEEDKQWITTVAYFALKNNFDAIIFWPFQYFVTYERFHDTDKIIDFSQRTPAFENYKNLISELRSLADKKR